ncbi:MAG TPA: diacylglycerol kinase family protein [Gaiellaceae bacterium]|nr:diacylglycerol kinase family protein [Gaiellaceae bacterium]
MPRVVLVVNPFATRVTEARLAAVEAELARVAEVEVVQTSRPLHAVELVREACAGGCDAIVVFSGDGGFNEALNGLDRDVPLGFLPGGGTSVFPRALGLPHDAVAAARRIAEALEEGRTRRISLGVVNGRRFGFAAGIGLDAEAIRRVDALGRSDDGRRPGDLAFALAVVRSLAARRGRLRPALEVRGHGRAALVLVANCSPYTYASRLSFPVAREARFELGLDFVAPRGAGPLGLPLVAAAVLSGRVGGSGVFTGHDLDRIELVCDRPLPLHADGEDLGDVEEAVFEAQRDAVSVLV